jgi:hypothetical protein
VKYSGGSDANKQPTQERRASAKCFDVNEWHRKKRCQRARRRSHTHCQILFLVKISKIFAAAAKENIFIRRVQMRHGGAGARVSPREKDAEREIESAFATHSALAFGAFSSSGLPTFAQSCMHHSHAAALSSAAVG